MDIVTKNGHKIALIDSGEKLIFDVQSALDFIMTVSYEAGSERVAVNKAAMDESFFILSTGFAGEVMQKFVNYNMKCAIYGDFSSYTSKALKDFIYECNAGHTLGFAATQEEAVAWLGAR